MSDVPVTEIAVHDSNTIEERPHTSRAPDAPPVDPFIEISQSVPLLADDGARSLDGGSRNESERSTLGVEEVENPRERTISVGGSTTVTCRVCENQIPYDSKSMQHVVRCPSCNEATPIRAAPTGKKFVRCPCNCLLICRISANRIACPRTNCARVIILKPAHAGGSAIPAPAGTARVQCVFCEEVFMLNTLAQQVAYCPHCQQRSSIGSNYVRTRCFVYGLVAVLSVLTLVFLVLSTSNAFSDNHWLILVYISIFAFTVFACLRCRRYMTMRISKVLGPL